MLVFLSKENKTELKKRLKEISHDIFEIAKELGSSELKKIGIKSITKEDTDNFLGYIITTTGNKKIRIENFTDVRYDFLENRERKLEEHNTIEIYVEEITKIIRCIKKLMFNLE